MFNNMFRTIGRLSLRNKFVVFVQNKTFLTNNYKCIDAWNSQTTSPILQKVNLNDFYNLLDQNFTSKGIISAIDVDIFANAIKEAAHVDELKELLHKLRLSAETGNTLDSTHHATIRNFIEFGNIEELINILRDPLNFGIFLDDYSANILLDKLITSENYEQAATVASAIMLQENFSNEITCTLCQYACYKYICLNKKSCEPPPLSEKSPKEEIKIRIKYLRNPYFDDHFDIKDIHLLSGKTLAWISERLDDNLNNNLQLIGWLSYKKYDHLISLCEQVKRSSHLYKETIELLHRDCNEETNSEVKAILSKCISILDGVEIIDKSLEESLTVAIENAINKCQVKDISEQEKLFNEWAKIREEKLQEQTNHLDRLKRVQLMEENQKKMNVQEQKLWFFENEEKIDLQIEEKEKLMEPASKQKKLKQDDENYVPPEIRPKRSSR